MCCNRAKLLTDTVCGRRRPFIAYRVYLREGGSLVTTYGNHRCLPGGTVKRAGVVRSNRRSSRKPDKRIRGVGDFFHRGIHSYKYLPDALDACAREKRWGQCSVLVKVTIEPKDVVAVGKIWYDSCVSVCGVSPGITEIVSTKITIPEKEYQQVVGKAVNLAG